jgi:hypothetical protein
MPFTGSQLASVHRGILGAYTRDELQRALRIGMDVSFDQYVPDKAFGDQVWALVEWAGRQDRVQELVRCAHEHNPSNKELAALWQDVQRWDQTPQESTLPLGSAPAPGHNQATVLGSGAIAQGPGAVAAGAGGIAVGGSVQGGISIGSPAKSDDPHPQS